MPAKRRRAKGDGALYQRASDGMWVGTIEAGYTAEGKRRPITIARKRQADAQKALRDKRREYDTHGDVASGQLVSAWLTYWLEQVAARSVRPRTLESYRVIVNRHLIPALGRRRLDQLAPEHVRAMQARLEAGHLAPATVLKAHSVLAKALTDAMRDGKATRNVAALVERPRGTALKPGASLTVDDALTLLRANADDPHAARWACALMLGARQGELLGLQWARVDLAAGEVDLSWQLQRLSFRHGCAGTCGRKRGGNCPARVLDVRADFECQVLDSGLCLTRPKSRAGQRVVPLPAPVVAILTRQRELGETNPHDLVWAHPDGTPIGPEDDRAAWYAALDRAGLPPTKLHNARHTAATFLLALDVDVKVIGQILGHNRAVTTQGYQHVDRTLARAAMDRLGELLAIED